MKKDYAQELDTLLGTAVSEGVSDIHLAEGRIPTVRSSGVLVPLVKHAPLTKEDILGLSEKLMTSENLQSFLKAKEINFSYNYKNEVRFRGNGYFQQGAIVLALRLIPKRIKTLEELGLPPILESFTLKHQGFFLVVGPIGHGKTTTLASLIEIINQTRSEHIVTIEDPIEYVYEPKQSIIDQREVRVDTEGFQSALYNVFRQDANILLIGEMRDNETIAAAVTAAETGHLVFSTLHTNSVAQTIDRIIDSFPAEQQDQIRIQLAGSLTGIFSQRLIPRISGGLIPAYELLVMNNAVANLIREKRTHEIDTIIETGLEQGMISMSRSLSDRVRNGEITAENAYLYSINPKTLERMLS